MNGGYVVKKIEPIKIPGGITNCIPEKTMKLPTVRDDKVWALKLAEKKPEQTDKELLEKLGNVLNGEIKEYQSRKRHIKWLCYWLMYQQICWFML